MVSPKPFNNIIRAFLASKASSASAERLLSDLGRIEGRQSQSILDCSLEMKETVRVFVKSQLNCSISPQSGTMHPLASAFKNVVKSIAADVYDAQK